jgi:hypothetical protein
VTDAGREHLLVNSRFFAVADNDFSDAVARQAMPCISAVNSGASGEGLPPLASN